MIPEHPHHLVVQHVGRGDDADVVQNPVAGLLPDEDLDALGPQAAVEQPQNVVLFVECLEQAPQPVDVRQFGETHQVGFAGDDIFHRYRRA